MGLSHLCPKNISTAPQKLLIYPDQIGWKIAYCQQTDTVCNAISFKIVVSVLLDLTLTIISKKVQVSVNSSHWTELIPFISLINTTKLFNLFSIFAVGCCPKKN